MLYNSPSVWGLKTGHLLFKWISHWSYSGDGGHKHQRNHKSLQLHDQTLFLKTSNTLAAGHTKINLELTRKLPSGSLSQCWKEEKNTSMALPSTEPCELQESPAGQEVLSGAIVICLLWSNQLLFNWMWGLFHMATSGPVNLVKSSWLRSN